MNTLHMIRIANHQTNWIANGQALPNLRSLKPHHPERQRYNASIADSPTSFNPAEPGCGSSRRAYPAFGLLSLTPLAVFLKNRVRAATLGTMNVR